MKAVPLVKVGQFRVEDEFPDPSAEIGRTLIKVSAVGLNRIDLLIARGDLGDVFPRVCGADVVGVVERCDSGRFAAGSRVLVNPALPQDGDIWPPSRECAYVRILGAHVDGGMAEYISVSDDQVYTIPAQLDDTTAATIPLDYLTAWRMLVTKAMLKRDESVLVWGAAGPLGCAALRICEKIGARAVAVGSRPADAEPLQRIGASAWLNYKDPDFADQLKAASTSGFDVIFESVGQQSWDSSIEVVGHSGRIVISGVTSGKNGHTDLEELYYKQVSVLGTRMGYPAEFEAMLSAIKDGTLRPGIVAETYSMRDASQALTSLEHRSAPGKIVLVNDL